MRSILVLILLTVASAANAAPVSWTINDAVFDDGGVLTGQFDHDAVANQYSNISIHTTAGTFLTEPADYGQVGAWSIDQVFIEETGSLGSGARTVGLRFEQQLSLAGGSFALDAFEVISFPDTCELLSGATFAPPCIT
jgi:hypothetical protein